MMSKSIWILRNIKELGNFRKSARKWFVYYCKWSTSYQECWV